MISMEQNLPLPLIQVCRVSFGHNLITYRQQLQDVEDFVHNDDVQNFFSVNKKRKGAFDGTFHTEQSSQHLSGSMLTLSLQIK